MKYYSEKTVNKVRAIANMPDGKSGFRPFLKYQELCDVYERASYYVKAQKSSLEVNDPESIIISFSCYDPTRGKVVNYELRAKKNYNKNQFIALIIGHDYFYMNTPDLYDYIEKAK